MKTPCSSLFHGVEIIQSCVTDSNCLDKVTRLSLNGKKVTPKINDQKSYYNYCMSKET